MTRHGKITVNCLKMLPIFTILRRQFTVIFSSVLFSLGRIGVEVLSLWRLVQKIVIATAV
jgi:hypothetical protein